ncbi:TIGR03752 family integrating conjugative element protein [Klebsiella oxytoca]|uniref:TIGR03752 family integrating conjugative element protein n=1 Tax=Klebsiella oxytoca TaxID=571 RepID=UPI00384C0A7B
MKLKMNPVVACLAVLFIAGVTMVSLRGRSPEKATTSDTPAAEVAALNPETLRELGIEGDTAQDTLNTLVSKIINVDKRLSEQEKTLTQREKEIDRLRREKEKEPDRVSRAVEEAREATYEQLNRLQSEVERLKKRGNTPRTTAEDNPAHDFPVGQGMNGTPQRPPDTPAAPGIRWVEPSDARYTDGQGYPQPEPRQGGGVTFPTVFGETTQKLDDAVQKTKSAVDGSRRQNGTRPGIPFWTLPENSTLMGSVAMTALIGRIPIDGNVTDPYPFKVVIGPDNLTANGIDLPDVEAAILSGTATGDWVLSCVRGTLTSFTLVFSDGRIRTLRHARGENSSNSGEGIGWLSDENGIPCVSGERKTNASTYLPTLFALSGAEAAADGLATSQTTSTTTGDSVISSLSGSAGQYALGKGLSGGTSAAAEWFRKRYGQMFDAIYVRPGADVAIHISEQLDIDYEEDGRLVDYGRTLAGYSAAELD